MKDWKDECKTPEDKVSTLECQLDLSNFSMSNLMKRAKRKLEKRFAKEIGDEDSLCVDFELMMNSCDF